MARSLTLFLSCCLLVCSQRIAAQTRMADSALNFFRVRSNINYTSACWQIAIDSALTFDSTVATLWQWKGMPYFKNADYASAMPCYDKAAHYDPNNYLSMRAFMKAVFAKDYEGGIKDFLTCKEKGYGVGLMDHSYDFFLGLCYKEIGDLSNAEKYMRQSVDERSKALGKNWVHWNDWFFLGIITMEKKNYKEAIEYFDNCMVDMKGYPNALYYKGLCLYNLGKKDKAKEQMLQAIENIKAGKRSSEDNDFYVNFPNQVYVADIEAKLKELYP